MLYPKIDTMFERDEKTFKVLPDKIKNPIFNTIKEWEFTEKIDGTNIRVIYDDQKGLGKEVTFGGRTDNAQLPTPLINYLHENISPSKIFDMFGDKKVIIFGEGYGGKIQKGSGYSPTQKFIVFDILVDDKYWLTKENIDGICANLGLDVVPFIGLMTLEEAVEIVKTGFQSKIGDGSIAAEGLIGRPTFPVFDVNGKRLICKIKTRDFNER